MKPRIRNEEWWCGAQIILHRKLKYISIIQADYIAIGQEQGMVV
ncbi:hypothetical protein [Dialister sp.]|nr:hypothetical protein [Dialister sp.]